MPEVGIQNLFEDIEDIGEARGLAGDNSYRAQLRVGAIYSRIQQPDAAMEHLPPAVDVAGKAGDTEWSWGGVLLIGTCHLQKQEFARSAETYRRALEQVASGFPALASYARWFLTRPLVPLGFMQEQDNSAEILDLYNRAEYGLREAGAESHAMDVAIERGLYYYQTGHADAAAELLQALIKDPRLNAVQLGRCLSVYGSILVAQGAEHYEQALSELRKAINILTPSPAFQARRFLVDSWNSLAELYEKMQHHEEAGKARAGHTAAKVALATERKRIVVALEGG